MDRIQSGTSQEVRILQIAILGVSANVLQGSQDIVRSGRWLRQMTSHYMEAQFIGYVARLDGNALRWGVAIDANGLQRRSCRLDIDSITGLEGVLKHSFVIRGRNAEVRYLCIPLTGSDQSPDPADSHQTGIHLHPNQGQKHHAN